PLERCVLSVMLVMGKGSMGVFKVKLVLDHSFPIMEFASSLPVLAYLLKGNGINFVSAAVSEELVALGVVYPCWQSVDIMRNQSEDLILFGA
ncbi:MAG TPA: hypothetical protein V6D20_05310, partial [Candidatus Obscuribacterales bacterium]